MTNSSQASWRDAIRSAPMWSGVSSRSASAGSAWLNSCRTKSGKRACGHVSAPLRNQQTGEEGFAHQRSHSSSQCTTAAEAVTLRQCVKTAGMPAVHLAAVNTELLQLCCCCVQLTCCDSSSPTAADTAAPRTCTGCCDCLRKRWMHNQQPQPKAHMERQQAHDSILKVHKGSGGVQRAHAVDIPLQLLCLLLLDIQLLWCQGW